ncbi:MAG: hypothetical protein Q4D94_09730 [Bacillota bacterium]|nr:hypothetical protein [Bacillota bacterium]
MRDEDQTKIITWNGKWCDEYSSGGFDYFAQPDGETLEKRNCCRVDKLVTFRSQIRRK